MLIFKICSWAVMASGEDSASKTGRRITPSGIPPRIALGQNALPDALLLLVIHEYPIGNFSNGPAAATADIIESGGTDSHARRVGSYRLVIH